MHYKKYIENALNSLKSAKEVERKIDLFTSIYGEFLDDAQFDFWQNKSRKYASSIEFIENRISNVCWQKYINSKEYIGHFQAEKLLSKYTIPSNKYTNDREGKLFWHCEEDLKKIENGKDEYLKLSIETIKNLLGRFLNDSSDKLIVPISQYNYCLIDELEKIIMIHKNEIDNCLNIGTLLYKSGLESAENDYMEIRAYKNGNWHITLDGNFYDLIQGVTSKEIPEISIYLNSKDGLVVKGETKNVKDIIKDKGLSWYRAGGFWYFRGSRNKEVKQVHFEIAKNLGAELTNSGCKVLSDLKYESGEISTVERIEDLEVSKIQLTNILDVGTI